MTYFCSMKVKIAIIAVLLLVAMSATAQTTTPAASIASVQLNYRIDYIRPDSFYLVEIKETISEAGKRGKVEEDALLLRDTAQINAVLQHAAAQQAEHLKRAADFKYMQDCLINLLATLNERKISQPSQGQ